MTPAEALDRLLAIAVVVVLADVDDAKAGAA